MTVVAEGSFGKAGDRLGIGRSAVSRSIRRLEHQLGARLLSRTTRSIALTREGEVFHASCLPGVAQISQALDDLKDLREGPPKGPLRVCASAEFGRKVVAPLLWGFNEMYPDVEIDLLLDEAASELTSNRVDVSFRDGRLAHSQIIAKQIVPMQMLVCASAAYAAAQGLPKAVDELREHNCINFRLPSGRISDWEFKEQGRLRRFTPEARLTFNDSELVLQAVLNGRGIAQLAGYQACGLLRQGKLVSCMPQYAPDDRGHYVCYQSRQHLPARIRVFVDYMTAAIRALNLQYADDIAVGTQAATSRTALIAA